MNGCRAAGSICWLSECGVDKTIAKRVETKLDRDSFAFEFS